MEVFIHKNKFINRSTEEDGVRLDDLSNKTTMATGAENYTENEACLKITYTRRVPRRK